MKFNLFLLLLATLLAVGSPQGIQPGLYHIQHVSTNTYWSVDTASPYGNIYLTPHGELWEIYPAGTSSYTISSSNSHLSLTFQKPDNVLVLSNAPRISPNLKWKIIPSGSIVTIQAIADPAQYVNRALFSDGKDYLMSSKSSAQWRLIPVHAFK